MKKCFVVLTLFVSSTLSALDESREKVVNITLEREDTEIKVNNPGSVTINNNNIVDSTTLEERKWMVDYKRKIVLYNKCNNPKNPDYKACLNIFEGQQFKDNLAALNEGERRHYIITMMVKEFENFLRKFRNEKEWQDFRNSLPLEQHQLVPKTLMEQKKLVEECKNGKVDSIGKVVKTICGIVSVTALISSMIIGLPLIGVVAVWFQHEVNEEVRRRRERQMAISAVVGMTTGAASLVIPHLKKFKKDDDQKLQDGLNKVYKSVHD